MSRRAAVGLACLMAAAVCGVWVVLDREETTAVSGSSVPPTSENPAPPPRRGSPSARPSRTIRTSPHVAQTPPRDVVTDGVVSVRGRVVTSGLTPLPGAEVSLLSVGALARASRHDFLATTSHVFEVPKVHARAEAGQDGGFGFEDVPPGDYVVVARADEHEGPYSDVVRAGSGIHPHVTLRLQRGKQVTGRVSLGDRAVPAAEIAFTRSPGAPSALLKTYRCRSEADGRFAITLPLAHMQVFVRAAGLPNLTDRVDVSALEAPLDLELSAPGHVTGRVYDRHTNEGLANAAVSVIGGNTFARTRSGENGEFSLEVGAGASLYLTVARANYSLFGAERGFLQAVPLDEVKPGETTRQDAPMTRCGTIKGRVLDADTGRGLAGADVEVVSVTTGLPQVLPSVRTAADGSYVVTGVPPRPFVVTATKDGWVPKERFRFRPGQGQGLPKMSPNGEMAGRDVPLVRGAPVEGFVRTSSGAPVANAVVTLRAPGDPLFDLREIVGEDRHQRVTDRKGRFAFAGVPRVALVTLEARHPAYPISNRIERDTRGGTGGPVPLVLRRGATIQGRLTYPDGRPAKDAILAVETNPDEEAPKAITDLDGRFVFVGLPARRTTLQLPKRPRGWALLPRPLELRDEATQEITLRLVETHPIRGKITDASGLPRAGVSIECSGETTLSGTISDATGAFTFEDLPPGPYTLTASLTIDARRLSGHLSNVSAGTLNARLVLR